MPAQTHAVDGDAAVEHRPQAIAPLPIAPFQAREAGVRLINAHFHIIKPRRARRLEPFLPPQLRRHGLFVQSQTTFAHVSFSLLKAVFHILLHI